jgi:hypothetical protein
MGPSGLGGAGVSQGFNPMSAGGKTGRGGDRGGDGGELSALSGTGNGGGSSRSINKYMKVNLHFFNLKHSFTVMPPPPPPPPFS